MSAANSDQGQLGQLGRLQLDATTCRATARRRSPHADARDQHREEQADRHVHDDRAPAAASGGDRHASARRTRPPRSPATSAAGSKKCQGEPNWCRLTIDEADSTITTPIRHSMATRITSTQKLPPGRGPPGRQLGAGPLEGRKRPRGSVVSMALPLPRLLGHDRGEIVAPGGVGRVPVEAGAARRQQHGVAGPGQARPRPDRGVHAGRRAPPAPDRRRPPRPRRRPRRWRPRPAPAGRWRASAPRSRPLLRPPAISTTEENPATAASTDAGVVALESSYQRTPVRFRRRGRPGAGVARCVARPRRQPARVAPAARATAAAARALARSWGRARGSSATAISVRPPATSEPVALEAEAGAGPDRESVHPRRRRGSRVAAAHTTGSSALTTAVSPVALVGPDPRLGRGVVRRATGASRDGRAPG